MKPRLLKDTLAKYLDKFNVYVYIQVEFIVTMRINDLNNKIKDLSTNFGCLS